MMDIERVFPPTSEVLCLLVEREGRVSVSLLIINLNDPVHVQYT